MHPPPPFPKHGHVFRLCPPPRFYKPPLFPSLHARKAEMPKRVPPILFFFRRNRKPFFFVERKWQRRPASSLFPFNQIAILCFSRLHICMREIEKWDLSLRGKPKNLAQKRFWKRASIQKPNKYMRAHTVQCGTQQESLGILCTRSTPEIYRSWESKSRHGESGTLDTN